jgi:hypothetical protein
LIFGIASSAAISPALINFSQLPNASHSIPPTSGTSTMSEYRRHSASVRVCMIWKHRLTTSNMFCNPGAFDCCIGRCIETTRLAPICRNRSAGTSIEIPPSTRSFPS